MKKFFKYGNKGFTLIELLVVIAILGTLAAVVILNVTKYIGAGHNEAAATELANVQTAVAAYMYDNTAGSHAAPSAVNSTTLAAYILNPINGTYTIDTATGKVTQTSYP